MENVISHFKIDGTSVSCTPFGSGHINSTYRVVTDKGSQYVLQKINRYVFKKPWQVMENAVAVTQYLRARDPRPHTSLTFVPTQDGAFYQVDGEGEYWRVSEMVPGFSLDEPRSNEDLYQSGLAFGGFAESLADFPAHTLHETIPNFHNTADRYRQFREAVESNLSGRLDSARQEVEFLLTQEETATRLCAMAREGKLPLRVTHNDTKLNNVMLDAVTGAPLCVLDLDTVMPGLSAYDFGDSIRCGAASAAEDEKDVSKMHLDLERYRVYTRGFLDGAPSLTELEIQVLPLGALTLTLESGVRFLKDYIDGDLYFHTAYPEHNLVRARTQIKLAQDMLEKMTQMEEITQELAQRRN